MNNYSRVLAFCIFASLLGLNFGCSTQYGAMVPNSAFVFPNSNVTPLYPVKAEKSKTWLFIAPSLTHKDIKATYDQALTQAPGANLLVNYREDTTLTTILFFQHLHYKIEGTAARMEVGKKVLN